MVFTISVVYQYFAWRVFIHGCGCQPGKNQYKTMKWARNILEELSKCSLVGIKHIWQAHLVWQMMSANNKKAGFENFVWSCLLHWTVFLW